MALEILRGPAGSGKSQIVREEQPEILADLTAIWAAIKGVERDSNGLYPERRGDDPALEAARYLKIVLVGFAARRGLSGIVTTSDSSPEAVEKLREAGATAGTRTVDPGEAVCAPSPGRTGRTAITSVRTGSAALVSGVNVENVIRIPVEVEIRESEGVPRLHATILQEGRAAAGGRNELFAPGSVLWPEAGIAIRTEHHGRAEANAMPTRQPGGEIRIAAKATPAIVAAVAAGRKAMSVEFTALRETRTAGGVREITRGLR